MPRSQSGGKTPGLFYNRRAVLNLIVCIQVVVVGFPATSIIKSRTRFCVSAAHSEEDILDVSHPAVPFATVLLCSCFLFCFTVCFSEVFSAQALQLIDDIADRVMLKYKHSGSFDRAALLKKLT